MSLVYLAARIYPYWATALIIVMIQVAVFYRRKRRAGQYYAIAFGIMLGFGIIAWFMFRGDIRSDQWIRYITGQ